MGLFGSRRRQERSVPEHLHIWEIVSVSRVKGYERQAREYRFTSNPHLANQSEVNRIRGLNEMERELSMAAAAGVTHITSRCTFCGELRTTSHAGQISDAEIEAMRAKKPTGGVM